MDNQPVTGQIERISAPPPDPETIKKHVDQALLNKLLVSRLVSGMVCAGLGGYAVSVNDYSGLGTYSLAWVATACLLVGFFALSERIAFVALGIVIGKLFF